MNKSCRLVQYIIIVICLLVSACSEKPPGSGSSNSTGTIDLELHQASFSSQTGTFIFYNTPSTKFTVKDSPADADWTRWAMLHDGSVNRLFVMKSGTNDTLYPFAYNANSSSYEHAYLSSESIKITGAPDDADTSSFSMLYDNNVQRLYFKSFEYDALHQFGLNDITNDFEYGYRSLDETDITNIPADIDLNRWGVFHDGETSRLLALRKNIDDLLYLFTLNKAGTRFEFGNSTNNSQVLDSLPETADYSSFSVLHDGSTKRFYFHSIIEQ